MELIKILRLVTGEDIISYVEKCPEGVVVRTPMEVFFKTDPKSSTEILLLNNWIPFSVLKSNETIIAFKDILCVLEPSKELNEYYENAVLSLEEQKSNKSELSASDEADSKSQMFKAFLQNLDPKELGSIH